MPPNDMAEVVSRIGLIDMTTHTHQTAPTHFVEANGIRFAYRRFGKASGVPLVFNMHFTGTMERQPTLTARSTSIRNGLSCTSRCSCPKKTESDTQRSSYGKANQ